jgi:DeoR/GlpR family transcriptional regulator of sugar metabolism
MKAAFILKTLPFFALIILLLVQKNSSSGKNEKSNQETHRKQSIAGTVTKVISDKDFTYLLVGSDKNQEWVATRPGAEDFKVGSTASFSVAYEMSAFESKELEMAFEKVYLAKEQV